MPIVYLLYNTNFTRKFLTQAPVKSPYILIDLIEHVVLPYHKLASSLS